MLNILNMPRERWEDWLSGYATGYLHGLEAGRTQGWDAAETQAKELWRRAYRIVQAHARIDSHRAIRERPHPDPVVSQPWPEPPPASPKDGQEGQATNAPAEPPPSSLAVCTAREQ